MGVITKNQAADLGFSLAESVDPLEFASNRTECDLITSEAGSENMIVTEIGFLTETECDISTGFSEKIFCGDYCRPWIRLSPRKSACVSHTWRCVW